MTYISWILNFSWHTSKLRNYLETGESVLVWKRRSIYWYPGFSWIEKYQRQVLVGESSVQYFNIATFKKILF